MNRSVVIVALLSVALLSVALGLLPACRDGDPRPAASRPTASGGPIEVEIRVARGEPRETRIPIVGTLFAAEEAAISTKVGGIIRRTHVDVGQSVRPGDPLAEVDRTDYAIAHQQAEAALAEVLARLGTQSVPGDEFNVDSVSAVVRADAQLKNARFTHDRTLALGERASNQEQSDVAARLRVAEAEYRLARDDAAAGIALARERQALVAAARRRVEETVTRTPPIPTTLGTREDAVWRVAARLVTEGQYCGPASPIYRLVITDPLKPRSKVPERYASLVRVGQTVELRTIDGVDAGAGLITRISPAVDTVSRTFDVEAVIENDRNLIKPGAFATGTIVADPAAPPIFVPSAALSMGGGVPRLFVVEEGKARRRDVRFGEEIGGRIEILSGLKEGESYIAAVVPGLADGAAVVAAPPRQARK